MPNLLLRLKMPYLTVHKYGFQGTRHFGNILSLNKMHILSISDYESTS